MIARKWVLKNEFQGIPKKTDFKLVQEMIPETLEDREILCKAEWLSVDPYMRGVNVANSTFVQLSEGGVMPGSQVARVIKSRHPGYPENSLVFGHFGWRDLTIFRPDLVKRPAYFYKLPDMQGIPESYALGAIGMPGNTAYFGVEKILQVKAGGTIVVSSAGGAVGGVVCQIAKIRGCKVLAFTGSFEKTVWLKRIGAGYIFDYNIVDVDKTLQEFAPEGVDYYFDNVGGEFSYQVMKHMKEHGRIAVCGAISTYNNANGKSTIPFDYLTLIYKKLRMEGFAVSEWENEWQQGLSQLRDWITEGKIQVEETITQGFENMPEAFTNLFLGKNIGKQVVQVPVEV